MAQRSRKKSKAKEEEAAVAATLSAANAAAAAKTTVQVLACFLYHRHMLHYPSACLEAENVFTTAARHG
jgi:hypothetical protein